MDKIEVQLSSGHGLVWNLDSVIRLRRDHRIIGALVGSDAKFPREEPGLPLLLSQQELHVLMDEGAIRLVYIPRLVMPPSQDVKDKADQYEEDSYSKQIQIFQREREASIRSFADRIVEGKKKKMLQKMKKLKTKDPNTEIPEIQLDKEKVIEEEIAKIRPIDKEHQVVQIFTQDPWMEDHDKLEARLHPPSTDVDKCRLFTFKTLWKKGYYIGEGSKFGGDYLVYLGDPLKFHASYIVMCLDDASHESLFNRPQDLVAKSRLGSQVHKTVLIAKLNENKDGVTFTSIRRNNAKRQVQYHLTTDDQDDDNQDFSEVEDKGEETEQNKSQGDTEKKDDTNKEDSSIDNPQEDMEEENEVEEGFEDEL